MKLFKTTLFATIIAATALTASTSFGADKKPKPYTLDTCPVSGDKLAPDETFTFVHDGREIKLCCKSCQKDFDKAPAKFVKKIEEAEAKAKKKKA